MQVVKSTQALEDLKELAASDSVDTFVLSYTSLLQVHGLPALPTHELYYPTSAFTLIGVPGVRRWHQASRPRCWSALSRHALT